MEARGWRSCKTTYREALETEMLFQRNCGRDPGEPSDELERLPIWVDCLPCADYDHTSSFLRLWSEHLGGWVRLGGGG